MIETIRNTIAFASVAALILIGVMPMLSTGWKSLRKQGLVICLAAAGFLCSMATKPPRPQTTWDTGIHDAGSEFDTNTWATVRFKWSKDPYVVGTAPLFFATKARDAGPDIMPVEIGETTCGALSWNYTFTGGENATNYLYYAYTTGSVHTNGTWTGNILIKRMPNGNIDQMVIIRAKLMNNGKVIAPIKE